MAVLRVCYKHGVRFDEAYYVSTHLPLTAPIMGPFGLTGVEVVKFGASGDGSAPPYQLMFSAHFATEAGLREAMQSPRMAEIIGDVPNYYDGAPDILIGDVMALPAPS